MAETPNARTIISFFSVLAGEHGLDQQDEAGNADPWSESAEIKKA